MRIAKNFDSNEFAQPARHGFPRVEYPKEWIENRLRPLCKQLEIIRAVVGAPIRILSGFRSFEYNRAIKGARYSTHCKGRAADIMAARIPARTLHATILELCNDGKLPLIHGLGLYPSFVHIDIRPSDRLARWTGGRVVI